MHRLGPHRRAARREQRTRVLCNEEDAATAALARKLYALVTHKMPSAPQRKLLGSCVHWSFGLSAGLVYERIRRARSLRSSVSQGAGFGLALWALGDELIVPLFGLSRKPSNYPASMHITTLLGHLGFGVGSALGVWLTEQAELRRAGRRSGQRAFA